MIRPEKEIGRFSASVGLNAYEESAIIKVKLYSQGGDDRPARINHPGTR